MFFFKRDAVNQILTVYCQLTRQSPAKKSDLDFLMAWSDFHQICGGSKEPRNQKRKISTFYICTKPQIPKGAFCDVIFSTTQPAHKFHKLANWGTIHRRYLTPPLCHVLSTKPLLSSQADSSY